MLGISLAEVYECVGQYVISSVKRLKRAIMCILKSSEKVEKKLSGFVIYSWYFKDNAFTVVERDAKFYTWCVKGVSFINRRYAKGGTFLSKTVYKRVIKGSNLRVEPPRIPFLWYPPKRCELMMKPKERAKRCCFNCNIWPNWFTSHQSQIIAYITMAYRSLWGNVHC